MRGIQVHNNKQKSGAHNHRERRTQPPRATLRVATTHCSLSCPRLSGLQDDAEERNKCENDIAPAAAAGEFAVVRDHLIADASGANRRLARCDSTAPAPARLCFAAPLIPCSLSGYRPLHLASASGHIDVCRLLLFARADVDSADTFSYSPQHHSFVCACF